VRLAWTGAGAARAATGRRETTYSADEAQSSHSFSHDPLRSIWPPVSCHTHLVMWQRMPRIEVDFWKDCVTWMRHELAELGHTPPTDDIEVAMHYVNLQRRRVRQRIRTALIAKELVVPAHHRTAFDALLRKMSAGEDLNAHLSRSVLRDANYDDALLNDWGMHHFHLGTRFEDDGFVERTDDVVCAIVHWDRVYVAGIRRHGEWAAHELIDAVDVNWPDLLTPLALDGDGPRYSPAQHKLARKSGVWPVTVLRDGRAVMPPGGGISTSGRGLRVSMRVGRMRYAMGVLQERFLSLVPEIEAHFAANAAAVAPDFHLVTDQGRFVATDRHTSFGVALCSAEEAAQLDA